MSLKSPDLIETDLKVGAFNFDTNLLFIDFADDLSNEKDNMSFSFLSLIKIFVKVAHVFLDFGVQQIKLHDNLADVFLNCAMEDFLHIVHNFCIFLHEIDHLIFVQPALGIDDPFMPHQGLHSWSFIFILF